jgi:hypothetical protein
MGLSELMEQLEMELVQVQHKSVMEGRRKKETKQRFEARRSRSMIAHQAKARMLSLLCSACLSRDNPTLPS